MIIVTVGGNMSPDSGWRSHMTHGASAAANTLLQPRAPTHRGRYRRRNTHERPLTLSFRGAVSPTPDRAEKELVNIVLGGGGGGGGGGGTEWAVER